MKIFILLQVVIAFSFCWGQAYEVDFGLCRGNTKYLASVNATNTAATPLNLNTCMCGYSMTGTRTCSKNEFCRKAKTEGFDCDSGTTFKGSSKSGSDLNICRSVKGCHCGVHVGNIPRTCAFGQWCQPTWEGFNCVDINNKLKFICPDEIQGLHQCTCAQMGADQGKQCNLYSNPAIPNNADNTVSITKDIGLACQNDVVKFAVRNGIVAPDKLASSSSDATNFPEFFSSHDSPKELDKFNEKYKLYDLVIVSNHNFDRHGILQIDGEVAQNTKFESYLSEYSDFQSVKGLFWLI